MSERCDFCECRHTGGCYHPGRTKFDAVVAERDDLRNRTQIDMCAHMAKKIDLLRAENTRLLAERDAAQKRFEVVSETSVERGLALGELQAENTRLVAERDSLRGKTDGHPEDFCHRCGGRNIGWYGDSDLWNRLSPPESIICPICFVIEAEAVGVKTSAWRVAPGDESPEAQRLLMRLHESEDRIDALTKELEAAEAEIEAACKDHCISCEHPDTMTKRNSSGGWIHFHKGTAEDWWFCASDRILERRYQRQSSNEVNPTKKHAQSEA